MARNSQYEENRTVTKDLHELPKTKWNKHRKRQKKRVAQAAQKPLTQHTQRLKKKLVLGLTLFKRPPTSPNKAINLRINPRRLQSQRLSDSGPLQVTEIPQTPAMTATAKVMKNQSPITPHHHGRKPPKQLHQNTNFKNEETQKP